MTTLHIVRQSAFNTNDFAQCIEIINSNDVIAFVDDGCYNLNHQLTANLLNEKNIKLNVIAEHAIARAITIDEAIASKITIEDLVSLTFETNKVITWQ